MGDGTTRIGPPGTADEVVRDGLLTTERIPRHQRSGQPGRGTRIRVVYRIVAGDGPQRADERRSTEIGLQPQSHRAERRTVARGSRGQRGEVAVRGGGNGGGE